VGNGLWDEGVATLATALQDGGAPCLQVRGVAPFLRGASKT
jgi:hypothetical protein